MYFYSVLNGTDESTKVIHPRNISIIHTIFKYHLWVLILYFFCSANQATSMFTPINKCLICFFCTTSQIQRHLLQDLLPLIQ